MNARSGQPVRIGIAGLGTVGAGVFKLIQENAELLSRRSGATLTISGVCARDRNRDRNIPLDDVKWYDDPVALASDPDIDVVVELIGGDEGPARQMADAALAAGKNLVTANKALVAKHGMDLAAKAEASGGSLFFEASVAGGIPIIKALREGLSANRIIRIYGILNGTCNYILTRMEETGGDFGDILAQAQELGYAEADPEFDVEGTDTAHKLAILTAVAYGCRVDFEAVHVEGISDIGAVDIDFARQLGYRIKLLGLASLHSDGSEGDDAAVKMVEQRVHPCLVPLTTPIAHVDDAFNAVVVEGDAVGRTVLEGRGAGAGPTASAVVADIVDAARGNCLPAFGVPLKELKDLPAADIAERHSAFYVRLEVVDQPGVMADITAVLRDHGVSIDSIIQRGRAPGEGVPVVMVCHETAEANMTGALADFAALDTVLERPKMIRIEAL